MANSSPVSRLPSEFDDFLFAPIGEDTNGMLLSVLSVLARSDVDPWEEAATLAGSPEKFATARLAALIAALPGRPSVSAGCSTIAARLVALLPRRATSSDARLPKAQPGSAVAQHSWVVMCVVLMALALGAQWVTANNQPSATGNSTGVPAAPTAASVVPPEQPIMRTLPP
jgi:hypothetical protein